jgi:hypothetical protein
MSKTLVAIIISSIIAVGVSATFLFPMVKNINSAISPEELAEQKLENLPTTNPLDQTNTDANTQLSGTSKDNPSLNVDSQNAFNKKGTEHDYLKSDTINSNYLIDDVPQTKR